MDIAKRYHELTEAIVDEHRQVFEQMDTAQLEGAMHLIEQADRVFVYGMGREGISLRGFAMRLAHLGKEAHWQQDDTTTAIHPGDLFITSCSRGCDPGSLEHICNNVKKAGGKILMFTADPDEEFSKAYADYPVWIHSTGFRMRRHDLVPTVQMMGNQYEQHLYMLTDVIIMMIVEELGLTYDDLEARHRNAE